MDLKGMALAALIFVWCGWAAWRKSKKIANTWDKWQVAIGFTFSALGAALFVASFMGWGW